MTKQNPLFTSLTRQPPDGRLSAATSYFRDAGRPRAPAAYAMIGEAPIARAASRHAAGGTLRLQYRRDLTNPYAYSWGAVIASQTVEYLTLNDEKNVTHPYLLENWDVSEDLKTWTLHVARTSSGTFARTPPPMMSSGTSTTWSIPPPDPPSSAW